VTGACPFVIQKSKKMKKLKLKNLSKAGNVLTSEELKHVYGGAVLGNNGSYGSGYRCVCTYTYYDSGLGSEYNWSVIIPNVFNPSTCKKKCDEMCNDANKDNCEYFFEDIY
jgi:natural product precursor